MHLDSRVNAGWHRGPAGGLDYCLCVISIILVRLDEGFYKLWTDQLYHMATSLKYSCPVVGSSTGFHHDNAGWDIGYISRQFMPR